MQNDERDIILTDLMQMLLSYFYRFNPNCFFFYSFPHFVCLISIIIRLFSSRYRENS